MAYSLPCQGKTYNLKITRFISFNISQSVWPVCVWLGVVIFCCTRTRSHLARPFIQVNRTQSKAGTAFIRAAAFPRGMDGNLPFREQDQYAIPPVIKQGSLLCRRSSGWTEENDENSDAGWLVIHGDSNRYLANKTTPICSLGFVWFPEITVITFSTTCTGLLLLWHAPRTIFHHPGLCTTFCVRREHLHDKISMQSPTNPIKPNGCGVAEDL
jgi:hypothetical protein